MCDSELVTSIIFFCWTNPLHLSLLSVCCLFDTLHALRIMKLSIYCVLAAAAVLQTNGFVVPSALPAQQGLLVSSKHAASALGMKLDPDDTAHSARSLCSNNKTFLRTCTTAALSVGLFLSASLMPTAPSHAAGYNALTDEQKVVAEAWRLVDYSYLDRTFNGQDWFKLRQDTVHRKYKSVEEARFAIDKMVQTLGDKYTRYVGWHGLARSGHNKQTRPCFSQYNESYITTTVTCHPQNINLSSMRPRVVWPGSGWKLPPTRRAACTRRIPKPMHRLAPRACK